MPEFIPARISYWNSIKFQVAVVASLIFIAVVLLITTATVYLTRQTMREVLADQETTLVTRLAAEIDDKLSLRRAVLVATAATVDPGFVARGPAAWQPEMEKYKTLLALFDEVALFSASGRMVADLPGGPVQGYVDVSRFDHIRRTLASAKPVISAPFIGATTKQPLVVLTAPVFGADGKVVAILTGAIHLLKPNFLGDIGKVKVGKTGYIYILTKGPRPIVVMHPRKETIMSPILGAAENPSTALAEAGFEGTLEGTNSVGMHGLFSYKSLHEVDWLLGAVLPAEEAFGRVTATEAKIRNVMLAVALLMAPVIWWRVYRRLLPLEALRANIQARRREPQNAQELAVKRRDEIGALTGEFNELMRERRRVMDALIESENRFRTITDNLPALIGYVDREERYRFNNQTYEEWFGVKRDALAGLTMREVLGEAEYAKVAEHVVQALQGYTVTHERDVTVNTRTRHVTATYLPHYGQKSEVLGFYILLSDISDRKAAERQLSYMAHHDPLTGLPNRILFNESLLGAIHRSARSRKPFALMYLDVDSFKAINDTLGHVLGDQLLKAFAARLSETVRAGDTVARLGGDEFVIIAEELGQLDDARLIARKIIQAMVPEFLLDGQSVRASTSIGVTLCKSGESDPDCLLKRADAALYRAKNKGKNTFETAEPGPDAPGC